MTNTSVVQDRSSIEARVREALQREAPFKGLGNFCSLAWLPGDASNRFYGRIRLEQKTLMLMVMNAPEAFKSEEVTGAEREAVTELPFVKMARELGMADVRVPQVFYVASNSEFLILEDLGDELLYVRRQKEAAMDWYEKALDELLKIQLLTKPVTSHRFTSELLKWETEHFVEYALLKRDKKISTAQLAELRNFLDRLVGRMSSSPYVLVHRDFHSKNLMVLDDEKRVGIIDFQDALMGPPTYDLASLLRDSYVRLEDVEEERLLSYFEKISGQPVDRELFHLTSLQRNLKAIGRFYYILMVKGRDTHIPFVSPSLQRVFKTLRQINELKILSLLEGLLYEEAR
jgi:aminoglycoside/choline kinase family phosphotransferase